MGRRDVSPLLSLGRALRRVLLRGATVTSGAGPSLRRGSNERLAGGPPREIEAIRDGATQRPRAAPVGRGRDRECGRRRGVGTAHGPALAPAPFFTDDAARVGLAGRDEALATGVRTRRLR